MKTPDEILEKYKLPKIYTALIWIHMPKNKDNAESARKRFAFEEVFYIQTAKAKERAAITVSSSYVVKTDPAHIKAFTDRFGLFGYAFAVIAGFLFTWLLGFNDPED